MTGPASGGSERGTAAPSRSTGTQGAVGAVLIVLALGLALRLIIAYLLPGSGLRNDLGAFQFWAGELAAHGPLGFYDRDFLARLHARLHVRAVAGGDRRSGAGRPRRADQGPADHRGPRDRLSRLVDGPRAGRPRTRLRCSAAAFVAVVNPISWFDSVVWGQVDSFGVVFMLLGRARAVARPARAGRRVRRSSRRSSSRSWASSSRWSRWSIRASLFGRRDRRHRAAPARRARPRTAATWSGS